ncbi:uncharacterized protein LOC113880657 [Bos indicus x Bos taurus]|uniref:uncharacterized protein LOC113880657 n=1 Tax=Bos indicus x Bos taurus TaxID=30522 RepID=UPI000F7D13C2|nr:uncharacterized protein LOC113880657 [Bos indicus x Bos taurus]
MPRTLAVIDPVSEYTRSRNTSAQHPQSRFHTHLQGHQRPLAIPPRPREWRKGNWSPEATLGLCPKLRPRQTPALGAAQVAAFSWLVRSPAAGTGEPGRQQRSFDPAPSQEAEPRKAASSALGGVAGRECRRAQDGCPGRLRGRERQRHRRWTTQLQEAGRMGESQRGDLEGKECVWKAGSARELRIRSLSAQLVPRARTWLSDGGWGRGRGALKVEE